MACKWNSLVESVIIELGYQFERLKSKKGHLRYRVSRNGKSGILTASCSPKNRDHAALAIKRQLNTHYNY